MLSPAEAGEACSLQPGSRTVHCRAATRGTFNSILLYGGARRRGLPHQPNRRVSSRRASFHPMAHAAAVTMPTKLTATRSSKGRELDNEAAEQTAQAPKLHFPPGFEEEKGIDGGGQARHGAAPCHAAPELCRLRRRVKGFVRELERARTAKIPDAAAAWGCRPGTAGAASLPLRWGQRCCRPTGWCGVQILPCWTTARIISGAGRGKILLQGRYGLLPHRAGRPGHS